MMLVMFSLAGVPPLFGFFAKLLVLQAAIHAGMMWLAIVGVVFAIIGLYYYLRVVKVMYFDKPVDGSGDSPAAGRCLGAPGAVVECAGLLVLGLVLGPAAWLVPARVRLLMCVVTGAPRHEGVRRIFEDIHEKACKNSAISLILLGL